MPLSRKVVLSLLLMILILAAFLRLYRLDQHDVITDEVFYGYRSIGLIDSLNSPYQPTPFETADPIPWWMRLSFHDHPPLGFWIQHLFFKIFGMNLWGLRLPFVFAGVASVALVYFIAKRLTRSDTAGLLSCAILTISTYHVWVSRIGLQESMVIFFMLLAMHLFLKSLEHARWFYAAVAAVGLGILMKYTLVALVPAFITYLLWKRRDLLTLRRMILSGLILSVFLSPLIIYNFYFFKSTGHLDFQLSYLLGQDVPEWEVRPGREVGGFSAKVGNLFGRLWLNGGPVFIFFLGLTATLSVWRRRGLSSQAHRNFLFLILGFLILLLLAIGPQERFLAMLWPVFAILIGLFFTAAHGKWLKIIFSILLAAELAISVNTNLMVQATGREGVAYTRLRRESESWGYNEFEKYFLDLTASKHPSSSFELRFPFAEGLRQDALARAKVLDKQELATLFVIDTRLHGLSQLWYTTRHLVYEGWPMIGESSYLAAIKNDPETFRKLGFESTVFVMAQDTLLESGQHSEDIQTLKALAREKGRMVQEIRGPRGNLAFLVYIFD